MGAGLKKVAEMFGYVAESAYLCIQVSLKHYQIMEKDNNKSVLTPALKRAGLTLTADRADVSIAIKTYRLRQDLTQEQLADKWNISRYTIMRLEAARPVSWEMTYKVWARLSEDLANENRA